MPTPTKATLFTNVNLINNAKWAYEMIKNVNPGVEMIVYPYNIVMMKHAPFLATEKSVKAHETRPTGARCPRTPATRRTCATLAAVGHAELAHAHAPDGQTHRQFDLVDLREEPRPAWQTPPHWLLRLGLLRRQVGRGGLVRHPAPRPVRVVRVEDKFPFYLPWPLERSSSSRGTRRSPRCIASRAVCTWRSRPIATGRFSRRRWACASATSRGRSSSFRTRTTARRVP